MFTLVHTALAAESAKTEGIKIHLAPDAIGTLFGIPITNTLMSVWLTMAILIALALVVYAKRSPVPGKLQSIFEALIGAVHSYMADVLESKTLATKFFPLVMTIFLFILTMNWVGLMPGIDSIGLYTEAVSHGEEVSHTSARLAEDFPEHSDGESPVSGQQQSAEVVSKFIPFFHPPATDLNITIGFAIVAFVSIELAGVFMLGLFKYGGKFINFSSPLAFIIGLIELLSELARLISFSFRLFGNIFAGKTLLLVIMFLTTPYILPVPLIAYEFFVGFIQAFIFAILTLYFVKLAIEEPH
jgi:F-type H+-transporting ATPase subunit a